MPEQFLDRGEVHARHDQAAGERMPRVMECEVLNLRPAEGRLEGGSQRVVGAPFGAHKDLSRAVPLQLKVFQGLGQDRVHRDAPRLARLGVGRLDGEQARPEIHVLPSQAQEFPQPAAGMQGREHDGPDARMAGRKELRLLFRGQPPHAARVFLEKLHFADRILAVVLAPLDHLVEQGLEPRQLPVNPYLGPGLGPLSLVAFEGEGVDLRQALADESRLEHVEALLVVLHRVGAFVGLGPRQEQLGRLVQGDVLPLLADARRPFEDRRSLDRGDFLGGLSVDALPECDNVPLPLMPEVEPPSSPPKMDAVALSRHRLTPPSVRPFTPRHAESPTATKNSTDEMVNLPWPSLPRHAESPTATAPSLRHHAIPRPLGQRRSPFDAHICRSHTSRPQRSTRRYARHAHYLSLFEVFSHGFVKPNSVISTLFEVRCSPIEIAHRPCKDCHLIAMGVRRNKLVDQPFRPSPGIIAYEFATKDTDPPLLNLVLNPGSISFRLWQLPLEQGVQCKEPTGTFSFVFK